MKLIEAFDLKYTRGIRALPASYDSLMRTVTAAGHPYMVSAIGGVGFIFALINKRLVVEKVFVYSVIAYGLNIVLKQLMHRRRPHGRIIRTLGLQSYSFPSGHAFGSVIFYGQLIHLSLRYLMLNLSIILTAALCGLILLIGVSRVYLGAHYPSDIIGGWILGAISLAVIIALAY